MRVTRESIGVLYGWVFVAAVLALSIEIGDTDSICEAGKHVVQGEFNYYEGTRYGGTVGMFTEPYYWWHAGEAFGGILLYHTFCESDNKTLESLIYNAMYHQAGENYDYIPSNQSMTEGNDDQGVWGLTIMEAVERNFTDPEEHSWLSMVQAIYNTMSKRWDTEHCNGGLRWQIFTWNSGYDYKNTISNGCLFHIAARLARYTNLSNYSTTAEKVWDWLVEVNYIEEDNDYYIHDGANVKENCTHMSSQRWSYTYGILMSGCAYMYNYTEDDVWLSRVNGLIEASDYFFNNSIMYESTCARFSRCNTDQRSFRSLFSRSLHLTYMLAPETYDTIWPWIESSAPAAAASCDGGDDGVTCGENWSLRTFDNNYGLGEQMSVLEVLMAAIAKEFPAPYTSDNGGSSKSNPLAGTDSEVNLNKNQINVKGKDRAGAGVLTAIVLSIVLGGAIWMAI